MELRMDWRISFSVLISILMVEWPCAVHVLGSGTVTNVTISSTNRPKYRSSCSDSGGGFWFEADGVGEIIDQFRSSIAHLHPLPPFMNSDPYLDRWLQAASCNLEDAITRFEACIQFRREHQIDSILLEDYSKLDTVFPYGLEGPDLEGRPVVWSPSGVYDVRKITIAGEQELHQRFVLRMYELLEVYMHETGGETGLTGPRQIVAIIDLRGFNLKQGACFGCLSMIPELVHNLEAYYPQFYHRIYYVNTPAVFHKTLNIAKNFMSARTRESISVFDYDKSIWGPELLRQIPAENLSEEYGGQRKGVGRKQRQAPLMGLLERIRQENQESHPHRHDHGHHHHYERTSSNQTETGAETASAPAPNTVSDAVNQNNRFRRKKLEPTSRSRSYSSSGSSRGGRTWSWTIAAAFSLYSLFLYTFPTLCL